MNQRWPVALTILIAVVAAVGWWQWPDSKDPTVDPPSEEFSGLAETKQKEIWDAEHATFEIETHVGGKIVDALRRGQFRDLNGVLLHDFQGMVPRRSQPDRVVKSGITETIHSASSDANTVADADAFISFLTEGIGGIVSGTKGRFRVLKIDQESDGDRDGVWRLQVLLSIGGTDAEGDAISYDALGSMACRFADDDDIVSGRIVASWNIDSETTRRGRAELMEEATRRYGLDRLPVADNWIGGLQAVRQYRFQSAVDDFDGDGVLDIALATADNEQMILRGNPESGVYEDVTVSVGLPRQFSTGNRAYLACWFDYDNDGDADLLLGETLYRNLEGKSFERVADNGQLELDYNPMGCAVADYDADGKLDLYILYQRSRNAVHDTTPSWVGDDASGEFNQLWRNLGNGTFAESSREARATGGTRHSFAAAWLHANDDHFPDLYVANDFSRNSLLINQGDGTFRDVADESGVGDFATSMGVAAGDIDGDGNPEIYVANMYSKMGRRIIDHVSADDYPQGVYQQILGSCAGNRLYSQNGQSARYGDLSEQLGVNAVGWAYAPAFADFDGDGLLDLYATAGFLSFTRGKPDG